MTGLLQTYPLRWQDPRIRGLRDALASEVYVQSEIIEYARTVGISPADLVLGQSARRLWSDLMDRAAGQLVLSELIAVAGERVPALKIRFAELLSDTPVVAAPAPAEPAWKNFTGREKQIVEGQPTLVDVAFLELGVTKAKAVCKFTVGMNGKLFYGTGFRVGERTLLTNHHVLFDWDDNDRLATSAQAEFGFELDLTGKIRQSVLVDCDISTVVAERHDDFAVINTAGPIPDGVPILPLAADAEIAVDDRVYIVQHPRGLPKKIAMLHNLVRHVDDDVVQYWTDTEPGSSGAPVFDERWRVVGLHHSSVDAPPNDSTSFRNQGRMIKKVAERLTALGVVLP
jgi:V8-like Glu-specific endopeptidase